MDGPVTIPIVIQRKIIDLTRRLCPVIERPRMDPGGRHAICGLQIFKEPDVIFGFRRIDFIGPIIYDRIGFSGKDRNDIRVQSFLKFGSLVSFGIEQEHGTVRARTGQPFIRILRRPFAGKHRTFGTAFDFHWKRFLFRLSAVIRFVPLRFRYPIPFLGEGIGGQ